MSRTDIMKTYVPFYLRESSFYSTILESEGQEMDGLRSSMEEVLQQFYVETSTDWGLDLWEQMLGLSSYTGKPLDQRRSRIISKIRGMGSVTVKLLKNVAESYVYGVVEVTEHPDTYSFTIKFTDIYGIPPNLEDLKATIEELRPAHLQVDYEFTYLSWYELDSAAITWNDLDQAGFTWYTFETWNPET